MAEHQYAQQPKITDNTSQKQTIPKIQLPSSHPMAIIQRAKINPKSLTHADVMQLQRTIGNRAVGKLLSEIGLAPSTVKPIQRQEIPEEEEPLQDKMADIVQCQDPKKEEPLQTKRENNTGMPENIKAGVESLSGIDMSNVRVHYNSSKPAEFGALAYTQGTDIHVAPGQERHLPHEAWHAVQQKQGHVQATMQTKDGVLVNDDEELEHEADSMGCKAIQQFKQVEKLKENKCKAIDNSVSQEKSNVKQRFEYVDKLPEDRAQKKLKSVTNTYHTTQYIQKREHKTQAINVEVQTVGPQTNSEVVQAVFAVEVVTGLALGGIRTVQSVRIGDRPPVAQVPPANNLGMGAINHITAWQLIEQQVKRAVENQTFSNAINNLNAPPYNSGILDPGAGSPMDQHQAIVNGIRNYLTAANAQGTNVWRGVSDLPGNVQGGTITGLQQAIRADESDPHATPDLMETPSCMRGYRLLLFTFDPPRDVAHFTHAVMLPMMNSHIDIFLRAYPQFQARRADFFDQLQIDFLYGGERELN